MCKYWAVIGSAGDVGPNMGCRGGGRRTLPKIEKRVQVRHAGFEVRVQRFAVDVLHRPVPWC